MSDRQLFGPAEEPSVDDYVYSLEDLKGWRDAFPDQMFVYIAGPMTNQPMFNYPAFDALEQTLTQQGYLVASPARMDASETRRQALTSEDGAPGSGSLNGETWGDFLARDVKVIADIVDGVVLMPGWEHSSGARLEAFICRHVGKPVFYSVAGGGGPAAEPGIHEKVCMCDDIGTDVPTLVELDDAELDFVLTKADFDTLVKIDADVERPELRAGPAVEPKVKTTDLAGAPADVTPPEGGDFLVPEAWAPEIQAAADVASAPPAILTLKDLDGEGSRRVAESVGVPEDGKATNPKDAIGSGKIPLHLWPQTATILGSLGLLDGMLKYGRSNWRAAGVRASIYVDAIQRHMGAWFEGEDVDPDSGLPHPAHALACLAIIVDAQAAGMLNDDRQFNGAGYRPFIESLTAEVGKAKERHADKDPKHYTIGDNS